MAGSPEHTFKSRRHDRRIIIEAHRVDRRTWPRVTKYRLGAHGRIQRTAYHLRTRWGTLTIDVRTGVDR